MGGGGANGAYAPGRFCGAPHAPEAIPETSKYKGLSYELSKILKQYIYIDENRFLVTRTGLE